MKASKILYSTAIIFFISFTAYSQKTIRGKVTDSNQSVKFCSIYYSDHPSIGTSSNEDGEFILFYADSLLYDSITFSAIGYIKKNIPVKKLLDNSIIELKPNTIVLNEVEVISFKDSIGAIMINVFNKFKDNMPSKRHQLHGYYQEHTYKRKDSTFLWLWEADIIVEDYAYKNNNERIRIKINQLRKSEDNRSRGLIYNLKKVFSHHDKTNNLFRTYETQIRKYNNPYLRFNNNFTDDHDFTLVSYFTNSSDSLIRVKYEHNGNFKYRFSYGYLTISLNDLSIKQVEDYIYDGFLNYTLIKFQKINNRYYPSFIKVIAPSAINPTKETTVSSIVFYKVNNNRNFEKIRNKHLLNREEYLHTLKFEEDMDFWGTYPYSKLNPVDPKIILSIIQNKPYSEINE